MRSYDEILEELQSSDRWGINGQPSQPEEVARMLSRLPVDAVQMKRADTLVVRFTRPLRDAEADLFRGGVNLLSKFEEDPFSPDTPKVEALCWWD